MTSVAADRDARNRIPVTLITGFLGSGKTTLLNAILRNPVFAGTLVIVNEFGEVGLDHLLVGQAQDQIVLLESGCLCCAASGSLRDTLIDLFARRAAGAGESFDRIFVETSGLAHPGPLVATLIGDSAIRPRCELAQVLTLVDAVDGVATLDAYAEARHQVAFADQLLITKVDKADERGERRLCDALHALNPSAPIRRWHPAMPPELPFQEGGRLAVSPNPGSLFSDKPRGGMSPVLHGRSSWRVASHTLHIGKRALSWGAYAAWVQALSARLGRTLLRCKGVLWMDDGHPWVVQGVQGYFASPERLPEGSRWPGQAFMVCIVDDVAPDALMAIAASIPDLPPVSLSPSISPDDNHG